MPHLADREEFRLAATKPPPPRGFVFVEHESSKADADRSLGDPEQTYPQLLRSDQRVRLGAGPARLQYTCAQTIKTNARTRSPSDRAAPPNPGIRDDRRTPVRPRR